MSNALIIKKKINYFKKIITVSGDKSISIRWVIFSSLANGISISKNLLMSQDVLAALNVIKKLEINSKIKKNKCIVYGKGINGYKYKKNLTLDAKNSGTLGRLILGFLINTTEPIKLIGDKSLSKRDFKRISEPLSNFGVKFKLNKNKNLPLTIFGSSKLNPIKYFEDKGSAQCKSAIIFGGMRANGKTFIKAKKSRNHTELLCKYLNLPVTVQKVKSYDIIKIKKAKSIKPLNYIIPSDISSSAFYSFNSSFEEFRANDKNVNINPSRTDNYYLKEMGISIIYKNKKVYKVKKFLIFMLKVQKH